MKSHRTSCKRSHQPKVELDMIQEGKLLPIPTPVVTRPVEEVPSMLNCPSIKVTLSYHQIILWTEQTLHFSSGLLCQRWHSCVPGITVDRHDAWPSFVEEDDMWLPNQFSNFIHRDSGMLSSWPLAIFCFCSAVGNRIVILKWPSLQYSEQRYL